MYHVYSKGETQPPGDWRFNNVCLLVMTLALRDKCKISEKIGTEYPQEARGLAKVLDLVLEKKYRGIATVSKWRITSWLHSPSSLGINWVEWLNFNINSTKNLK